MRSSWRASAIRALAAGTLVFGAACSGTPHGPLVRVTIPSGSSFRAATDSLHHAGFVGFPRLFRLYAMLTGGDRDIKAGTYGLQHGMSWAELVGALREGQGLEHKLTIPEGWSLHEIVPALARALGAPEDSVRAAVRDTALLRELDIPTPTLEGYLFPDTYIFSFGTSPRVAVREMVTRFEQVWQPAWDERLQQLAMSRNDIVTLASIVEKEAKLPEERPVISAVYHNRLHAQMPLQADPTVQYALGEHHERLLYKDLEVESPYNTYRHPGLPPGPIASPGKASIEAALYPASVPYLYFVAHPDGHHEFRTTFREHTEAKAEVRRERERYAR
ncbi:MAG TPA: endolytic transglycosylase MltG [Gemmatimonadaceae bacterium]|nr:endolytic transglycosylase MltG [Gemmatimonadaceae bacterium]